MKIKSVNRSINLIVPRIMGILNITPDSFFDGGKYLSIPKAIDHVSKMINEGADIIDVGGESTRPGATYVSEDEEMSRVIPVISALLKRFDIFLSINTSKAIVMKESIAAGVDMINDVRSLSEPNALEVVANSKLPVCLMHMKGNPSNMQKDPKYKNILLEIKEYFLKQISRCKNAGIQKDRLLIDPGFGFGKKFTHNYDILSNLSFFKKEIELPILVGLSRKSMISKLMDSTFTHSMIIGSVSCAIIALLQGVNIIRVHDVKYTAEAMKIVKTVLSLKKSFFNEKL